MNRTAIVSIRQLISAVLMCIAACASAADDEPILQGKQSEPPNDRLHVQTERDVRVTTAVPSAEETRKIFGVNLYGSNIQPVWVQVENLSDKVLYLTPMGTDRAYFTPRETVFSTLAQITGQLQKIEQQIEEHSVDQLMLPPESIQSGYIFTRLDEGTKSFNVDVVGNGDPYLMSFFVPVPGLRLDHYSVDVANFYAESELRDLSLEELATELENMPCCVRDKKGVGYGDPLNLVFIGDVQDLYYAFLRSGWDETETIYGKSLLKTGVSAVAGGEYRYSPVSALYVFGRPQDAAMQKARGSIHERNHLRIWITNLRHAGKPVWIGQISRDIGVRFTRQTITTHKIDPDVDETREYLLEDLAYAQSLAKIGYVGGVGAASYDEPRGNLTGDPYFTDGQRVILWIAEQPRGIDEIEVMDLTPP